MQLFLVYLQNKSADLAKIIEAGVMKAKIEGIEYYLPDETLTNEYLAEIYPEWSIEKIENKTGVRRRHIAKDGECASDLGIKAAEKLFLSTGFSKDSIDFLLFCTQSPDYRLPSSACLIQDRLGLGQHAGALDINLGCSGYIYGLSLAKGLIESGQARNILFITAETYSKYIHPDDRSVRTIFGDAAAATIIVRTDETLDESEQFIGPFVFGTDGSGGGNLIVPVGGSRFPTLDTYRNRNQSLKASDIPETNLYMNGSEIFNFTLRVVPECFRQLLKKSGKDVSEIDRFVFHQANRFMLDHLRRKLKIPKEKYFADISNCGNTVSCTIPIALKQAQVDRWLEPGHLVMLIGFGVGLSWSAALIQWNSRGYYMS
jgi:3-oxoacyl-[acyl-carrier-protein] synthase-3